MGGEQAFEGVCDIKWKLLWNTHYRKSSLTHFHSCKIRFLVKSGQRGQQTVYLCPCARRDYQVVHQALAPVSWAVAYLWYSFPFHWTCVKCLKFVSGTGMMISAVLTYIREFFVCCIFVLSVAFLVWLTAAVLKSRVFWFISVSLKIVVERKRLEKARRMPQGNEQVHGVCWVSSIYQNEIIQLTVAHFHLENWTSPCVFFAGCGECNRKHPKIVLERDSNPAKIIGFRPLAAEVSVVEKVANRKTFRWQQYSWRLATCASARFGSLQPKAMWFSLGEIKPGTPCLCYEIMKCLFGPELFVICAWLKVEMHLSEAIG